MELLIRGNGTIYRYRCPAAWLVISGPHHVRSFQHVYDTCRSNDGRQPPLPQPHPPCDGLEIAGFELPDFPVMKPMPPTITRRIGTPVSG